MKKRPDEHSGDALDGDRRGGRRRPAINDGVEASQRRSPHLLIVGVDDLIAGLLKQRLSLQGYEVNAVDSLGALRAMTPESESDIVLVASELAVGLGENLVSSVRSVQPLATPIVLPTLAGMGVTLASDGHTQVTVAAEELEISGLLQALEWCLSSRANKKRVGELRSKETWLAALLRSSREGILTVSASGEILGVNTAAEALFGLTAAQLSGQLLQHWIPRWHPSRPQLEVSTGVGVPFATYLQTGPATERPGRLPVEMTVSPMKFESETVLLVVIRDVSDQIYMNKRLRHAVTHDTLTGLPTRSLWTDRLETLVAFANRNSREVAVAILDIDRFKLINERFGHDVGDRLLQEVARKLEKTLRQTDTLIRLDGDSFVVAAEVDGQQGARRLAARLERALAAPIDVNGYAHTLRASIGVSLWPRDSTDTDELLRFADSAMEAAKQRRTGGSRFFKPELRRRLAKFVAMEEALKGALRHENNRHLFLDYQPVYNLKSNAIVGAEALLRWRKDDGTIVPPAEMIPVAEQTGLINELGAWVLESACAQGVLWGQALGPDFRLAVNVSPQQLLDGTLLESVLGALDRTGFDPQKLELEVTETVLLRNVDASASMLMGLCDMGVSIAIDDFGTGYSSLSLLKHLPVGKLKIDRSFVSGPNTGDKDDKILSGIISLGGFLGLNVVAEGIETSEQLDSLERKGCLLGQGYFLGRPGPPDDILG